MALFSFSFLAQILLLYMFLQYNPWMSTNPNSGVDDNLSRMWPIISPFWNQLDRKEALAGCVEATDELVPMTSIERIISANESCHSISKHETTGHRIVNGQLVGIGSRLFQVALFRRNKFACGGSFVSRRFVLTAAHCVQGFKPQELRIRYATRQYDIGPIISVHSIYPHPEYNQSLVENDLALLRLAYPLPRIPFLVDRIELNQDAGTVMAANHSVVVSGWGRTGRSLPVSRRLLMATLKTVDKQQCQEQWANMFKVHPTSMICASDPDKSACNGDSGGPLTMDNKLVGIVSVGSSTCLSIKRPNVYTNVAYFHNWIQKTINAHF